MKRFIFLSFVVLAWAYYEMSGGADFVAQQRVAATDEGVSLTNDAVEAAVASASTMPAVPTPSPTRATTVSDAVADAPLPAETLAVADPDPATSVIEPAADDVSFVSLSQSSDGTALTAAAPEAAPEAAPQPDPAVLRAVDATLLNVREGPSTGDGVIGQLTRGEVVTLVSSNGDGWSLVRLEGDGLEGWVANRFLVAN